MKFLSEADLPSLRQRGIGVPHYDRRQMQTGVVHFGPGAFHRAHQADYFNTALEHDLRWGICEVALNTTGVRDALLPQQGLYTVARLDAVSDLRVLGAISELLVAPESPARVIERIADPAVHLITMTVTEKGYCVTPEGHLDRAHAGISHDLEHPQAPQTVIGLLVAGLRKRHASGIAPPVITSCDNLADNSARLRNAVIEFAERDAVLSTWIGQEIAFPKTMVDSITPATDHALRERVAGEAGLRDRWPVQREAFTQWVIEDDFRAPTPDWEAIGVTVTNDVAGYERAKLRLLNGAHSSLAYLGLLAGYETVMQAMNDASLSTFIRDLMREHIAPTITAPAGLDILQYVDAILRRFRNPAIRYQLAQIAGDSSQKLPFRLAGTIGDSLRAGRSLDQLCMPIAAWFHFVRRKALKAEALTDPLAAALAEGARQCTGQAEHDVEILLGSSRIFSADLMHASPVRVAIERAYARVASVNSAATLHAALRPTD